MYITFLPYYAHQMNLFVGEIFKESDRFKQASTKTIKIALYFKSLINKYFIDQLWTLQKELYGNIFKLQLVMIQDEIAIMNVFIL